MVKSGTDRLNKYTAKIVGDVVKNRIDAQKDFMTANASPHFDALSFAETKVGEYCDPLGITPLQKPYYMSFIRKCYMLKNKHTDVTLHDEVCIAAVAWGARGLNLFHLATLVKSIYTVDIFDCTA